MPLVFSHFNSLEKRPRMSVPAGLVARISRAAPASCHTCVLMRSTSSKSARMPSSMMRRSMLTMWACRILRRFTTSVICMRVRNSLACAFTAKMLTSLVSMSSSTAARHVRQRPRRQVFQYERAVPQRLPVQLLRQGRADLAAGSVGNQRGLLFRLNAQAGLDGVARAGRSTPGRIAGQWLVPAALASPYSVS